MIDSIFKAVRGIFKLRGATDGTLIGNASDAAKVNLRNAAGTETGISGTPIRVDPTGTTTQPVSAASLPLPTGAATSANQSSELTLVGAVTETAPASDTASSGLNGRLQRIAQRLTSLLSLLPTSLGQKTMANSLAVTVASDQSAIAVNSGIKSGGTFGNVSVPTANTAVEVKVGGSRLSSRRLVTCIPDHDMFWGYSSSVTTANGTALYKNQLASWDVFDDTTQIWVVCGSSSKNIRVTEAP